MAVRTANRYGIVVLVYLMAFGLANAQDNRDKEKVRIHSSKSGKCTYVAHIRKYIRMY
jgi:hypothetical protein